MGLTLQKTIFFWLGLFLLGLISPQDVYGQTINLNEGSPLMLEDFSRTPGVGETNPGNLPQPNGAVTPCVDGMAGSFPCSGVDLNSLVPVATFGAGEVSDVWGWTHSSTGREFALVGLNTGTAFVEVTDPNNPVFLGTLATQTSNSIWHDIKVFQDHAYIVSEANSHGMQVFDLTQLLSVGSPPQVFSVTSHYGTFGSAHNIAINEDTGFAYVVGADCSGGLHMIDLSTPGAPVFAGCFSADGYTHDVQCVTYQGPDADWQGQEICVASNEDTVTVVDVADKLNPQQISRAGYSGVGYTHQGWFTEDQAFFLLGDEGDEQSFGHPSRTRIWDMADLDAPVLIGVYDGETNAIDHNVYTRDGYAFEANYRAGLRILSLDQVASGILSEVSFFDTYPSSNSANFNGAWSNYPYFPSGTVIVTSIETGLFVLTPTDLQSGFRLLPETDQVGLCSSGTETLSVGVAFDGSYSGTVDLSLSGLPTGIQAAILPASVSSPQTVTVELNSDNASLGSWMITLRGENQADGLVVEEHLSLTISESLVDAPQSISPTLDAVLVDLSPKFEWNGRPSSSFLLEVSTQADLSGAMTSSVTVLNHIFNGALVADTQYFWRVTETPACGSAKTSPVLEFTTTSVTTTSYCLAVPVGIADNDPVGTTQELVVTDNTRIQDLNVSFKGLHNNVSDLFISIDRHSEEGQQQEHAEPVVLLDRAGIPGPGCSGNHLDVLFDDQASQPAESTCESGFPAIRGTVAPEKALLGFNGESTQATWQLFARDEASGDSGIIQNWCLLVEAGAASLPGAIALNHAPGLLNVEEKGGQLHLDWGPSCSGSANDYAVYQGSLGDFQNMSSSSCSSQGGRKAEFADPGGDLFFLIVPMGDGSEGSYGQDSSGVERTPANTTCQPSQILGTC